MPNRLTTILRQSGGRVLLKGVVTIGLLIGLGFLAKSLDVEQILNSFEFDDASQSGWLNGQTAFAGLASLLVAIGAPRQAISFFAAYLFGFLNGLVLALICTVCGCMITYSVARIFHVRFRKFVEGRLDFAIQFWMDNTFLTTLIIRLLPAGSNFITNLAAGAMAINRVQFFSGSAAGYVPQTLVFAMMGAGVNIESGEQILISIVLFIISAVLGLMLYGRFRKRLKSTD